MDRLSSGQRTGVVTILIIVAVVTGVAALRARQAGSGPGIVLHPAVPGSSQRPSAGAAAQRSVSAIPLRPAPPEAGAPGELVIHIVGAVRRPGVYHLRAGARADDALRAAGGPTALANTNAVNLAAHLEDGTQFYVPTHRERPEDHAGAAVPAVTTHAAPIAVAASTAGRRENSGSAGGRRGGNRSPKLTSPEQGQIDLNRASAAELQRIPGIGPSMAERLIAYRQQNGGFHSVEDLLQVSGIGDKKYEKIQPYVKVK